MTPQNFNIVSSKSLEKQLKVVEARIQDLQTEIHDLEKIRDACHTLLGTSSEAPAETAGQELAPVKKKAKRAPQIETAESDDDELEEDSVRESEAPAPLSN